MEEKYQHIKMKVIVTNIGFYKVVDVELCKLCSLSLLHKIHTSLLWTVDTLKIKNFKILF